MGSRHIDTTKIFPPTTTAEWPTRGDGAAPLMYGRDHESRAESRMCLSTRSGRQLRGASGAERWGAEGGVSTLVATANGGECVSRIGYGDAASHVSCE